MKTQPKVLKLVEAQCKKWHLRRKSHEHHDLHMVITISRQTGSNGHAAAHRLAEQLGLDFFGHNLIHEVAEEAHIADMIVESLDEKGRSFIDDLLASLQSDFNLTSEQYLHHLARVLGAIAEHKHAVILGRGANLLLPSATALRVRFIAPLPMRIARVMADKGLDEEKALAHIQRKENERAAYLDEHFGTDPNDPRHYDLVINDEHLPLDAAIDLIAVALRSRM